MTRMLRFCMAAIGLLALLMVPAGTVGAAPGKCGSWQVVSNPISGVSELNGLAVVATNDIWAVGDMGADQATLTEHWNGSQWSVVKSPGVGTVYNLLSSATVVASNNVWAVGAYQSQNKPWRTLIEHWDGKQWSVVKSPNVSNVLSNYLWGVAAVSANDIWAVGDGQQTNQALILHWDGTKWRVVPNRSLYLGALQGVVALSQDNVWAVGDYFGNPAQETLIEHWNGKQWSVVTSPNPLQPQKIDILNAVSAISSKNIWAVGLYSDYAYYQTLVEHWDGKSWSYVPSPSISGTDNELTGVAAVAANNVWAVGDSGTSKTMIEHWNGKNWSIVKSPSPGGDDQLNDVKWVPGSPNVWTVGARPNLYGKQLIEFYC